MEVLNRERLRTNKEIVESAIHFVTIIYGEVSIEFLKEKVSDYLKVFYKNDEREFWLKFIYFDKYNPLDYLPKNIFEEKLQQIIIAKCKNIVNLYSTDPVDILSDILFFDLRKTYVLLCFFGLVPKVQDLDDLSYKYNISPTLILSQFELGVGRLAEYINVKFAPGLMTLDEIRKTINYISTGINIEIIFGFNGESSMNYVYELTGKIKDHFLEPDSDDFEEQYEMQTHIVDDDGRIIEDLDEDLYDDEYIDDGVIDEVEILNDFEVINLDIPNKEAVEDLEEEVTSISKAQIKNKKYDALGNRVYPPAKNNRLNILLTKSRINSHKPLNLTSNKGKDWINHNYLALAQDITGASNFEIKVFLQNAEKRIADGGEYEITSNGRILRIKENSSQAKLIKAIVQLPDLLYKKFLTKDQKKIIKVFFQLKRNSIYPSSSLIAYELNRTRAQVEQSLQESARKIELYLSEDATFYLDSRGMKLKPNSGRYQLLTLMDNPKFRAYFRDEELEILDMYMKKDDRSFEYSHEEIVIALGLDSENVIEVLIKKAVSASKQEEKFVNENGRALKPGQIEVLKLIKQFGLENLTERLTASEYKLASFAIEEIEGRYRSISLLSKIMDLDVSNIKRTFRRIIDKIRTEQ
ncbi:MAG: hypothetical protein ACMG57_05025 [Candidatus Dojkabacteria bacterium]